MWLEERDIGGVYTVSAVAGNEMLFYSQTPNMCAIIKLIMHFQ
jgi:hypothetical protein